MKSLKLNFISTLGKSIDSEEVRVLFEDLQTMHRPSFDSHDDEQDVYEWVLVKRKGIELGFIDKNYYLGMPNYTWYHQDSLLAQIYFYKGVEGVADCVYAPPFDIDWNDSRERVIHKMQVYSDNYKASFTDTWNIDGILITINYDSESGLVNRVVCQLVLPPLIPPEGIIPPDFIVLAKYLVENIDTSDFINLWQGYLEKNMIFDAYDNDQIDFTSSYGLKLNTSSQSGALLLYSIRFYANREEDSVGWQGKLPFGIEFSDSPNQLFEKIVYEPRDRHDSIVDGYAVWDFESYSLHVLYSNFTNQIQCVTVMIPSFEDDLLDIND